MEGICFVGELRFKLAKFVQRDSVTGDNFSSILSFFYLSALSSKDSSYVSEEKTIPYAMYCSSMSINVTHCKFHFNSATIFDSALVKSSVLFSNDAYLLNFVINGIFSSSSIDLAFN